MQKCEKKSSGAFIAAAASAVSAGTFLYLIAPEKAQERAIEPFIGRNFAHRGLHTTDRKTPENSVASFSAAAAKGYGSELDVQLSLDGEVFVFHDDTLPRVTGTEGVAEELPWSALKELRLAETDETIPLFVDVLRAVDGRVPLIVELKTTKRYRELSEKTLDILLDYRARTGGDFCVESFDPRIVRWFKKNAPEIVRGQLSAPARDLCGKSPTLLRRVECFFCANVLTNFLARPNFIAYSVGPKPFAVKLARKLGATLVSWTSLDPEEEKEADAVIFQYYEPKPRYR